MSNHPAPDHPTLLQLKAARAELAASLEMIDRVLLLLGINDRTIGPYFETTELIDRINRKIGELT